MTSRCHGLAGLGMGVEGNPSWEAPSKRYLPDGHIFSFRVERGA
jgi:hypothetical protein